MTKQFRKWWLCLTCLCWWQYEQHEEIRAWMEALVERLRDSHVVFDIGALLIKPVQRILKYPLLLSELSKVALQCTYCEIIFIRWTFNFMYFVSKTIHEFKIPMKCWLNLIVVCLIWKSTNSHVHEHVHDHQTTKFCPRNKMISQ